MKQLGIWEPYEVKVQTLKTAIEAAVMLLRIDDIVSGIRQKGKQQMQPQPQQDTGDNVHLEPFMLITAHTCLPVQELFYRLQCYK